jgi:hypothetical protein
MVTSTATTELLTRRYIPIVITTTLGIVQILAYFLVSPQVQTVATSFTSISVTLATVAVFIATLQLILRQGMIVRDGKAQMRLRLESMLIIFFIVLMAGAGIAQGQTSDLYRFLSTTIFTNWSAGEGIYFALWFTFLAYRGFRLRTREGLAFMLPAILMIIANSSWSEFIIPGFPSFATWMNDNMIQPVMRGILVGGSVGGIASTVRALMGKEAFYMRG